MSKADVPWTEIEAKIRALLATCIDGEHTDTLDAVEHYLYNAEFELAFEGLLLDIMKLSPAGLAIDWTEYVALAELLKLNEESVLDPDFWEKFRRYTDSTNRP